jgi:hypothetical protein
VVLGLSVPPQMQCKCNLVACTAAAAAAGYGTHQNKQLTRAKIDRGVGMPVICPSYKTGGKCRRSFSSSGTATSTSAAAPLSAASLMLLLLQLATSCCDGDAERLCRFIAASCIGDRADCGQNWRSGQGLCGHRRVPVSSSRSECQHKTAGNHFTVIRMYTITAAGQLGQASIALLLLLL